jgi:hypothetical protein
VLTTVLIVAVVAASLAGYWWLGRVWPDAKDLQQRIQEHRREARALLRSRPVSNHTQPPDERP